MTEPPQPTEQPPGRGRLFVVTGSAASARAPLARALAARLDACVLVDGDTVAGMLVAGARSAAADRFRELLLRWSACIAVAETYQLEGFDAVITDVVLGDRLEDFLDLVAPEPVHLIVVDDDGGAGGTPRWGLWLDAAPAAPDTAVEPILGRLDDALVTTDA